MSETGKSPDIADTIVGFIYVIENGITGKLYVGQTKNPDQRKRYQFSRFTHSRLLRNALAKYGQDNFDFVLLERCSSLSDLSSREIYWIAELNTLAPNGYNLTDGGETPVLSEETKALIGESRKGRKNPMYGKSGELSPTFGRKHTDDVRKKISEIHRGKIIPKELREYWSIVKQGTHNGVNNPFFGKKHSEASRKKIGAAIKGRKVSAETKERMRLSALALWRKRKEGNKNE